jgi:hypothetical protein
MTRTKIINQIRKFLKEEKTIKDKISTLTFIKIMVEADLERLKRENDKKQVAYDAKTRIIKKALKQFLNDIDKIFSKHEELGDTDVREQLTLAVHRSFVLQQSEYTVPSTFGMFSDEGNQKVQTAVQRFLAHPEVTAASKLLRSWEDRLAAFQDYDVKSTEGNTFFEYFGSTNKPGVA